MGRINNVYNELTPREREIAELMAWGAAKKEVALHLSISERTVENHTRSIYEKTGCNKATELSAWWFCSRFSIPFSLAPKLSRFAAAVMLCVYIYSDISFFNTELISRQGRQKRNNTTTIIRRIRRRNETYIKITA